MLEGYQKINAFPAKFGNPIKGLRHHKRSVLVEAVSISNGMVYDKFELSYPRNLVKVLHNLEEPCKQAHCEFRFTGIEEQWWPLGLGRTRKASVALSKEAAFTYLAA